MKPEKTENNQSRTFARATYNSGALGHVLKEFRVHYEAENEPESLVVPYVLTCAAWLESKINDTLHRFLMRRYDEEVQRAVLSLQLPKKLNVLVPLLTEGRYRIKKEHFVYQRLAALIQVRNSITHAKPQLKEIDAADAELVSLSAMFPHGPKVPLRFLEGWDITLGTSKQFSPLEYHDALEKLEKHFFRRCPDRLGNVAMVIDRSKEPQWEEERATLGKFL